MILQRNRLSNTSLGKHIVLGWVLLLLLIVQRPPEEHDVRLRAMDGVMDPTTALLNSNRTPLIFGEESILGQKFRDLRRKNHMPVLVRVVAVLLGILDLMLTHPLQRNGRSSKNATDPAI